MDPESNYKLILQEGAGGRQEFELSKAEMVIGRAPSVDIVIAQTAVSGRHALITQQAGQYTIEDLNSTNGTFINGQRLMGRKTLNPGDEIRLGQSIIFRVQAPDIEQNKTVVQAPPVDATMLEDSMKPAIGMAGISLEETGEIEGATQVSGGSLAPEPAAPPPPPVREPVLEQPAGGATMIYEDFMGLASQTPAQFQIAVAGAALQTYTLNKQKLTIGRADDNDIVIPSRIVSRHHATLEKVGDGYQIVPNPEAGNPVLFEGRPLGASHRLSHEDKLRVGGLDPGSMVTMTYLSPRESVSSVNAAAIHFGEKSQLTIGRDPSNDVVLDTPAVSRYHAQIERVGQRYRVRDLRSSNGTFVNGQRIEGDHWLQADDAIRVGPHRFELSEDRLAQYDESRDLRVEALNLNKWVRKDLNILQDISVVFQPREFIVTVGQSGGGKSTLVDAIAGYRPATDGAVYVNDLNVYENFDAIRNDIGFVPQRDIIHMELTVYQALNYAAQLRMPPDTTKEERKARIEEVLDDLDLAHRRDVQISGLSGGQQKRVSIGVELLTKPGLFYLDEPTSGLDPGTETSLMQLMRRLADQGRTITLITHATKNVMLANKVVFLARGGYLTWFGPPDEALAYFDQYRSERDRRAREIEFDEIYSILDDSSKGSPEEWRERYRNHPAYEKYIAGPLRAKDYAPTGQHTTPAAAPGPKKGRQVSGWRQFLILSSRNIKILTRDRFGLILMLAAPPIVSLLDVILALVLGRDPFASVDGSMPNVMITLFLLTVYGVMVGGLAQMREIVKEQDVYKRERLVNLRIFPYVMSKIWVAAILALYASAVYMIVHYLAFDMPGGSTEFVLMYISLTLATFAGMMLGLFASTLAPNANSAPLIVVLLMLPQIVLGGALVPLPETITAPISTRWAFQAFMGITGVGSDVAADACWTQLDEATQKSLTLEQKNENCRCMGTNALRAESCNYPGLGKFYNPVIDEPAAAEFTEAPPVEPIQPPEPAFPEKPQEPADQEDQLAMAKWREDFLAWENETTQIKSAFDADMERFQAELELYQAQREAYETRRAEAAQGGFQNKVAIETSVLPAEELIRQFYPGFGWTYVDKYNANAYRTMILKTWAAQGVIILVLFVLIVILLKRKDSKQ